MPRKRKQSENIPWKAAVSVPWHVAGGFPLLSQERLVRACHFSRGGFQRLCSSSISRLEPSLPPSVHYLNKQEARRGRLAALQNRLSLLVFSLFLHNKCASQFLPLLSFLPQDNLFLFLLRHLSPLSPSLSLARSSALSKHYTVTNNYPFHEEDAARKLRTKWQARGCLRRVIPSAPCNEF